MSDFEISGTEIVKSNMKAMSKNIPYLTSQVGENPLKGSLQKNVMISNGNTIDFDPHTH